MVCYLALGNRTTIRGVEAEMAEKLGGAKLIVAGDLNLDLGKEGSRGWDK